MGLLDAPSPILSQVDALIGLPALARIAIWGSIGAMLSMGLYALLSPQRRVARLVAEERRLKAALRRADTEMADGMQAARRLLSLALARIGLVLGPALVGAVPVVCLMVWLETHYARDLPEPAPAVQVWPDSVHGRWVSDDGGVPRVELVDDRGEVLQTVSLHVPVAVVHKRAWWNGLIGNPLGYLAADGEVERVEIDLPARRYLAVGPGWLRGWEAPFLAALLAVSVGIKLVFRIR
jgi:hypothetical protein